MSFVTLWFKGVYTLIERSIMDPLSQWVGNLGFPIAAYLLMYRLVTSTLDRNTQAIHTVSAAMNDLRDAVKETGPGQGPHAR